MLNAEWTTICPWCSKWTKAMKIKFMQIRMANNERIRSSQFPLLNWFFLGESLKATHRWRQCDGLCPVEKKKPFNWKWLRLDASELFAQFLFFSGILFEITHARSQFQKNVRKSFLIDFFLFHIKNVMSKARTFLSLMATKMISFMAFFGINMHINYVKVCKIFIWTVL